VVSGILVDRMVNIKRYSPFNKKYQLKTASPSQLASPGRKLIHMGKRTIIKNIILLKTDTYKTTKKEEEEEWRL
jgi:hypothetical protein